MENADLLDYEDEEQVEAGETNGATNGAAKKDVKGTYVSIHSSGFRDFLLKPESKRHQKSGEPVQFIREDELVSYYQIL